jgi:hypothetical protein
MPARVARWSCRALNADAPHVLASPASVAEAPPARAAEAAVDVSKEGKRLRGVRPRAEPRNARLDQSECPLSVRVAPPRFVRRHMIDERSRLVRMSAPSSHGTASRHNIVLPAKQSWHGVPSRRRDRRSQRPSTLTARGRVAVEEGERLGRVGTTTSIRRVYSGPSPRECSKRHAKADRRREERDVRWSRRPAGSSAAPGAIGTANLRQRLQYTHMLATMIRLHGPREVA